MFNLRLFGTIPAWVFTILAMIFSVFMLSWGSIIIRRYIVSKRDFGTEYARGTDIIPGVILILLGSIAVFLYVMPGIYELFL